MNKSTRSLDVLARELGGQRALQIHHFESLDNKAGVVLGFSGLIVAVGRGGSGFATASHILAVVGVMASLWTFMPREYPVLDMRRLRDRYLAADPEFTRLHVLDTQIEMEERTSRLLQRKSFRLKLSVIFLATAVLLLAGGILWEGGQP